MPMLKRRRKYVKLYVVENLSVGIVPDMFLMLIQQIDNRNMLDLTPYKKKKICKKLKVSEESIRIYLDRLEGRDVCVKLGTGTYFFNPYLFMRSSARDFEKIYQDYLMVKTSSKRERKANRKKYFQHKKFDPNKEAKNILNRTKPFE